MLFSSIPFLPLSVFPYGTTIAEFGLCAVWLTAAMSAILVVARDGRINLTAALLAASLLALVFTLGDRPRTRLAGALSIEIPTASASSSQLSRIAARTSQARASDAAILAGGIAGAGSELAHPETIPRGRDDLVFAAFAANYGLVGVLALATMYASILLRILMVGGTIVPADLRAILVGFAALLGAPLVASLMGAYRGLPLTGLAVAFIGAGGSKHLASCLIVGACYAFSDREDRRTRSPGRPALPSSPEVNTMPASSLHPQLLRTLYLRTGMAIDEALTGGGVSGTISEASVALDVEVDDHVVRNVLSKLSGKDLASMRAQLCQAAEAHLSYRDVQLPVVSVRLLHAPYAVAGGFRVQAQAKSIVGGT
jgi:hypothetical protein